MKKNVLTTGIDVLHPVLDFGNPKKILEIRAKVVAEDPRIPSLYVDTKLGEEEWDLYMKSGKIKGYDGENYLCEGNSEFLNKVYGKIVQTAVAQDVAFKRVGVHQIHVREIITEGEDGSSEFFTIKNIIRPSYKTDGPTAGRNVREEKVFFVGNDYCDYLGERLLQTMQKIRI